MRVEVAVDDALLVQMVGRSGNIEREAQYGALMATQIPPPMATSNSPT